MRWICIVAVVLGATAVLAEDIPFTVSVNAKSQLEIGRVSELRFQIQSQSDNPVIILEIRPEQPCEEPISLVKALYGRIEYDEKLDSYLHHSLEQQQSMIPVIEGYLAPGGTKELNVKYRPFRGVESFQIDYSLLGDQKVYAKGGTENAVWFAPDGTDFTQVIISRLSEIEKRTVPLTVSFQPILGTESNQCYCQTLEGYEVSIPPSLCKDWDTGATVRFRIGEAQEGMGPERRLTGRKFLNEYPIFFGDGMYSHGEFIEISPEQAKLFIEKVRRKYLMNRIFYFFSQHYYDLEPVP